MTTPHESTAEPSVTPAMLIEKVTGVWISQAIYVVAKLGVADLLTDGPKTTEELAHATKAQPQALGRVLRAVASEGIFAQAEDGRWEQTKSSEMLRSDVHASQRWFAIMMGEEHLLAWAGLLDSVRTGGTAFDRIYGKSWWDHCSQNPETLDTFNRAMTALSTTIHAAIPKAYDFSRHSAVMDVGGGHGALIEAILNRHPGVRGIVFDMPHVVEGARRRFEAASFNGRASVCGGSFFEAIPRGADAHILTHIIHDWDDERALTILRNCRRALPKGGTLLLGEIVIPPGNGRSLGKLNDINMLVMNGGRERTEDEYRDLCHAAGFRLERVIPTESPVSVVEGVAA